MITSCFGYLFFRVAASSFKLGGRSRKRPRSSPPPFPPVLQHLTLPSLNPNPRDTPTIVRTLHHPNNHLYLPPGPAEEDKLPRVEVSFSLSHASLKQLSTGTRRTRSYRSISRGLYMPPSCTASEVGFVRTRTKNW